MVPLRAFAKTLSPGHPVRSFDRANREYKAEDQPLRTRNDSSPATLPQWMDEATYNSLPDTMPVREFMIQIEGRDGNPENITIVSSLTDPTIPQQEIADLFWRRWNCELDLRSIKQSMHLDVLRCKTLEMCAKEIYCHLLAFNLLRGVMTEAAKKAEVTPRQLSVKGTMQAVESFTPAMMMVKGDSLYGAFLTTVAAHRVGNRPGRQEPRAKKRRPSWQTYMTTPRRKSHRKLVKEMRGVMQ